MIDANEVDLVKRVVKCMAVSPSSMSMAHGAISVLDSLGLWNYGEIESEQISKADIEMVECFTKYLFDFAKRRELGDFYITADPEKGAAFAIIGDYMFYFSGEEERWSYRPKSLGGATLYDVCQHNINPNRISSFKEPPAENYPATADQSTAG